MLARSRPNFRYRISLITALLLLALAGHPLRAIDVNSLPKPTGYVSDLAHVLDASDREQLETLCTRIDKELGAQLAIVTIDTLNGQDIRDFGLELGRHWGIGPKQNNQGVLLILSIKDHKSDLEAGRGIEPYLTDAFSGTTLRAMRSDLRSGDYGQALLGAAQAIAAKIADGKGITFSQQPQPAPDERPEHRVRTSRPPGGHIPFPLIIFGIFLLLWLLGRGRRGGGGGGGGGGFWAGILLGNLLSGGRRYGGNDWGQGGGFGGGSGGSGGFGGFGGGDFGGGGASSDW
jgi:uncharacterized protein